MPHRRAGCITGGALAALAGLLSAVGAAATPRHGSSATRSLAPRPSGLRQCTLTGSVSLQGAGRTVRGLHVGLYRAEAAAEVGQGPELREPVPAAGSALAPVNADGSFRLSLPGRGALALGARAPGYEAWYVRVEAPRDCGARVEFRLVPARSAAPILATLWRSPCMEGQCPAYGLVVHTDGLVEWYGEGFVASSGQDAANLLPADLAALERAFAEARFLELQGDFECGDFVDLPTATLSYRSGGRSRTLRHAHGCVRTRGVKALMALEKAFDAIVHTERWVGRPLEWFEGWDEPLP